MASKGKAKTRKRTATKDLTPRDGRTIQGGRKSGEGQQDYLIVKMKEAMITGISATKLD